MGHRKTEAEHRFEEHAGDETEPWRRGGAADRLPVQCTCPQKAAMEDEARSRVWRSVNALSGDEEWDRVRTEREREREPPHTEKVGGGLPAGQSSIYRVDFHTGD